MAPNNLNVSYKPLLEQNVAKPRSRESFKKVFVKQWDENFHAKTKTENNNLQTLSKNKFWPTFSQKLFECQTLTIMLLGFEKLVLLVYTKLINQKNRGTKKISTNKTNQF